MPLGERLKAARIERGLSQEKLGLAVGITKATVSQIEDGSIKRTTHVVRLAEVLGVSPKWLESGEGSMDAGRLDLTQAEKHLVWGFRTLNEADRVSVLRTVEALNALTYGKQTPNQ